MCDVLLSVSLYFFVRRFIDGMGPFRKNLPGRPADFLTLAHVSIGAFSVRLTAVTNQQYQRVRSSHWLQAGSLSFSRLPHRGHGPWFIVFTMSQGPVDLPASGGRGLRGGGALQPGAERQRLRIVRPSVMAQCQPLPSGLVNLQRSQWRYAARADCHDGRTFWGDG
jgi:hypothetical protein